MIRSLFALLAFLPCAALAEDCLSTGKNCADVDIDAPQAEASYQKGCDVDDFYACARLGQFYETKRSDMPRALKAYDKSCRGQDEFGCTQAYNAYMELCFHQEKKQYCGKMEPKDEYRILAFLRGFSPKYKDAFADHDFQASWTVTKAERLYAKLLQAKSKKLLRALEAEKRSGKHDGADGEALSRDIACLKGDCKYQDPLPGKASQ